MLFLLAACGSEQAPSDTAPARKKDALLDPALAFEKAPDEFRARFKTTKGDFVVRAKREWSPNGVDRFYNLIRIGYYQDVPFYRMMPGFVAQFGFHWNPKVNAAWARATIPDDRNRVSNFRGFLSFASKGPNTRTCQMFINLSNNANLDRMFPTVAEVVEGMEEVVVKLNDEYRDAPEQERILAKGSAYLDENYPRLDYIRSAEIIE